MGINSSELKFFIREKKPDSESRVMQNKSDHVILYLIEINFLFKILSPDFNLIT